MVLGGKRTVCQEADQRRNQVQECGSVLLHHGQECGRVKTGQNNLVISGLNNIQVFHSHLFSSFVNTGGHGDVETEYVEHWQYGNRHLQ